MILSPGSRHLGVTDVERSVAFYRDVLGFDARRVERGDGVPAGVELVSGQARIEIGTQEWAYDSTLQPRPRGTAILFFETDDVAAMREAVVARHGEPSTLEKVNWIKMEVFQIRDPDGHTIWFGQSFQQPDPPPDPKRQLEQLLPELPVSDVAAATVYYRDVLGFTVTYADDGSAVMDRDGVTVLLTARGDKYKGIGAFYAYVRDVEALHAELTRSGAQVQGAPVSQPWGLRDFCVIDPDGNRIRFGQPFE